VIGDDGRMVVADADGKAVVRLHAGETRTVWVVPRQGSFAMTVLSARGNAARPATVVVPQAVGSLRITNPLRSPVMISYNSGRPLPGSVIGLLRKDAGDAAVFRLIHLPAGVYAIGANGARWTQVTLSGGEQTVELVPFRRPLKY
jgi:hypothetical protein